MRSTFFGLELAKKALRTFQKAEDVVSHNIANASTPGYTRQEAVIKAGHPYTVPYLNRPIASGQVGTGVYVSEIRRLKDEFIDSMINLENQGLKQWEVMRDILVQIQAVFNEPSDDELGHLMDQFWASWEELSKNPTNGSLRANVVFQGQVLCQALNSKYEDLVELQIGNNTTIENLVSEVNSKAKEIADLNKKIRAIESIGDNANDLRDERDLLIKELSEIVNVSTETWDYGQIAVYIGSKVLVQNDKSIELITEASQSNPQILDVKWSDDKTSVNMSAGKLKGAKDTSNIAISYYLDKLNQLSESLIVEVNTLHSSGYGLQDSLGKPYTGYNFFSDNVLATSVSGTPNPTYKTVVQGIKQLPEGTTSSTLLSALGVNNGGVDRSFVVNGTTITITAAEYPTMTLQNLLDRITQQAGVTATYNSVNRRIRIERANSSSLVIDYTGVPPANQSNFISDAVAGLQTANTGDYGAHASVIYSDAAARIAVNSPLTIDYNKIACASTQGGVPGDGSNALAIAQLKQTKTMTGMPPSLTFDDFYNGLITDVGLNNEEAERMVDNYELKLKHLENRREEISGVSLDEELANMIKFQRSYEAAARMFQVMDEMLQALIGTLGR